MNTILMKRFWRVYHNQILAVIIPLVLAVVPIICNGTEASLCGFVLLWMAVYYISMVVPLGVTALLPLLIFPLLGVLSSKETALSYTNETVWVMFGTLVCGIAFENVGLHRRAAFSMLKKIGTSPIRLMWSFSLLSFFISMWTTNTATALGILTILDAMEKVTEEEVPKFEIEGDELGMPECNSSIELVEISVEEDKEKVDSKVKSVIGESSIIYTESAVFKTPHVYDINISENGLGKSAQYKYALGLGLRYGCTFGGLTTPMGSVLNFLILELAENCYAGSGKSSPLTFTSWLGCMIPVCLILLFAVNVGLQIYFFGIKSFTTSKKYVNKEDEAKLKTWVNDQYDSLGTMSYQEWVLLIMFTLLALLWFFLDPGFIPGWANLSIFKEGYIGSVVPTYLVALPLFILPKKKPFCLDKDITEETEATMPTIMDWEATQRLPWHLLFIMSASTALSKASTVSGLEVWISVQLEKLFHLNTFLLLFVLCLIAVYVTEILSSTLMLNIFIPIMCILSRDLGKSPLFFAFPVALCITANFMMPNQSVNTLCLQYKKLTMKQMLAVGFIANLLYVVVISVSTITWFDFILNLNEPITSVNTTMSTPSAWITTTM